MKYMVLRTSDYRSKPCKEATKETYLRHDVRTTNDPSTIGFYKLTNDWWYSDGLNHRIVNNQIVRDFEDTAWFIEINTLEELLDFINKHGQIILTPAGRDYSHDFPELEIYDGYRE